MDTQNGTIFKQQKIKQMLLVVRSLLKSVEEFKPVHYKQLLTYLKLMDKQVGLLINFNVSNLTDGVKRIVNDY